MKTRSSSESNQVALDSLSVVRSITLLQFAVSCLLIFVGQLEEEMNAE